MPGRKQKNVGEFGHYLSRPERIKTAGHRKNRHRPPQTQTKADRRDAARARFDRRVTRPPGPRAVPTPASDATRAPPSERGAPAASGPLSRLSSVAVHQGMPRWKQMNAETEKWACRWSHEWWSLANSKLLTLAAALPLAPPPSGNMRQ